MSATPIDMITPLAPLTPAEPVASSPLSAPLLALLQATDRNGNPAGRLDITHWPVTIGRALHNDLVLDDSHLAASHLRIDRNPEGGVRVDVLDTDNGIVLDTTHHGRGGQFAWPAGKPLLLGRLKLGLRLAEEAVPAEEPLPRFPWRTVGWTALAVGAMLVVVLFQSWLTLTEPSQLPRQLPGLLGMVALGIAVWAGLWALATKLFTGRLQFWRHVRIACATSLAVQAFIVVCGLLAFMFSLESLAKFETLQLLAGLAVAVYLHLAVIVPQGRRRLGALVAGVAMLIMVTLLGTSWMQNKRFSGRLYMTTIYPPGWRMAPAVPVKQFMDESGSIKQRLDARLKDKESEDGPDDDSDSE